MRGKISVDKREVKMVQGVKLKMKDLKARADRVQRCRQHTKEAAKVSWKWQLMESVPLLEGSPVKIEPEKEVSGPTRNETRLELQFTTVSSPRQ